MAIDPVCKMDVDEKKAAATYEYQGKSTIFVQWAAGKISQKILRSFLNQRRNRRSVFERTTACWLAKPSFKAQELRQPFLSKQDCNTERVLVN